MTQILGTAIIGIVTEVFLDGTLRIVAERSDGVKIERTLTRAETALLHQFQPSLFQFLAGQP